jgi:hypothetical protein
LVIIPLLLVLLLQAGPVSAGAAVLISVTEVAGPGHSVILVGHGLVPDSILQARWDSASAKLRLIWVDSTGNFRAKILIPTDAAAGSHKVSLARVSSWWVARTGGPDSPTLIRATPFITLPVRVDGALATYGPGIGMDSLNNTQVGGPDDLSTSHRFRATTSSRLDSIRVYIIGPTHPGYGAGTGGTWEVTVQADDGSAAHGPSGAVLATTTFQPVDDFPVIAWSSPASLTAGRLYHVVFRNIDPDPTANYASLDGVFMYQPTVPRQAAFSDVDWGQPLRSGSDAWSDRPNTVPIMELDYADGVTAGLGYMEVWVRSYKSITGDAKAREAFTVSGPNRAVGSFSVRLMRISGSSPLTVRLETSGGGLIEEGSIAAAEIPVGIPGDHGGSGHATWETYAFAAPRTLVSGASYNVVLSTASDTVYSTFVIRKGSSWGFSPTTYFRDGHAEYTTGGSWGPFTQDGAGPLDEGDLQAYFR